VTALKNEPGRNIGLSGSVSAVRQLLAAGLLDELHLLVHPIAVRKGLQLFDEGETPIPLKLISSETFKTGVLNLVYGPAEPTDDATYEDAKVHLPHPVFDRRPRDVSSLVDGAAGAVRCRVGRPCNIRSRTPDLSRPPSPRCSPPRCCPHDPLLSR
jgi:hypothetical protein